MTESCTGTCKACGFTGTKHVAVLAGVTPRTIELAFRSSSPRFEDYLHVALLAQQLAEKEALPERKEAAKRRIEREQRADADMPARHKRELHALEAVLHDC